MDIQTKKIRKKQKSKVDLFSLHFLAEVNILSEGTERHFFKRK